MENLMSDIFLIFSGVGGILIGLFHGYIGQTKILSKIGDLPTSLWRVNFIVFQLSAVYWVLGGVLLCLAPSLFSDELRTYVALTASFLYASASAANLWATRGKHFGWPMLAVVATGAFMGA